MMDARKLIRKTRRVLDDNSPSVLAAVAVIGTVATAYLTWTATWRASDILNKERKRRETEELGYFEVPGFTRKEEFDLTWKCYIPPLAVMAVTTGAIVCSNRIGLQRTAAYAAAYSLSERAYDEYKSKVVEKLGLEQHEEIAADVAKDKVEAHTPNVDLLGIDDGDYLCLDRASMRYFRSTMEKLRKVENDINAQIIHADTASLSEYYEYLGMEPTSLSEDVGWNVDKMLVLHFSPIVTDKGIPCLVVDFGTVPMHGFRFMV